jgi:hypothetical protein
MDRRTATPGGRVITANGEDDEFRLGPGRLG